jgi:tRNA uridine 5-carboxymethylaminomethyl modification enzyme
MDGVTFAKYLKRPEVTWEHLMARSPQLAGFPPEVTSQVVCDIKYEGYVARQGCEIERQKRLAMKTIPETLDYDRLTHLRAEAREKLSRIRPASFAQAGRISGITPADLALLTAYLDAKR